MKKFDPQAYYTIKGFFFQAGFVKTASSLKKQYWSREINSRINKRENSQYCIGRDVMLTIIRYINGKKIDGKDLSKYVIECDIMLETIKAVNERTKNNFHKETIQYKKQLKF